MGEVTVVVQVVHPGPQAVEVQHPGVRVVQVNCGKGTGRSK